jgi:peptidoglycan hydrolase CwlO-like protein
MGKNEVYPNGNRDVIIFIMSDTNEKILKVLENLQADVAVLRTGQQTLQGDMQKQGKRLEALETGQKTLESGQQALELKFEAVHAYQKQAHDEIMEYLIESNEITGKDQQKLEKRVDRIEKHLDLPPFK